MDNETLSVVAIILSVVSAIIALWSAWTNHRALTFTRASHERKSRLIHAKACSELIEETLIYASSFERELEDIAKLRLKFDSLPSNTQNRLSQYLPIFTDYQPKLEGFARQARALSHEVYEWSEKDLQSGPASRGAHFRRLLSDDQQRQDEWRPLLEKLRLELNKADPASKSR